MHEIKSSAVDSADYNTVRRVEGFESIAAEYPAYLTDESKFSCQPFDLLFFPKSEAELHEAAQGAPHPQGPGGEVQR